MLTRYEKYKLEQVKNNLIKLHEDMVYIDTDVASHIDRIIHEVDQKIESGEVRR